VESTGGCGERFWSKDRAVDRWRGSLCFAQDDSEDADVLGSARLSAANCRYGGPSWVREFLRCVVYDGGGHLYFAGLGTEE